MTPREHALSRAEILTEALAIVDEDGLDALSMRALAGRLGVEAMSLYHHFPSKGAILDGLAASVLLGMQLPTELGGGWREAAEEACVEFRRVLMAHPNVLPIMLTRPFNTGEASGFMTGPLDAVIASGLDPASAGEMYFALVAMSFGHAAMSARSDDTRPVATGGTDEALGHAISVVEAPDEASFRRAVKALMAGFSAG